MKNIINGLKMLIVKSVATVQVMAINNKGDK